MMVLFGILQKEYMHNKFDILFLKVKKNSFLPSDIFSTLQASWKVKNNMKIKWQIL